MSSRRSKCEKFVYATPDGGWGYMVVVGVVINLVIFTTFNNCYDMLFKELLKQLHVTSTGIAFLKGMFIASHSISGFMTRPLLKLVSFRKLALSAAAAYSFGQLLTVFARSKTQLFICQGIIQGFGSGLLVNLSFSIIIEYFEKKRLLAVSIAQTMAAVATLTAPSLVKWCLDYHGSRATLLFLSATTMNTILSATLMQPAAWHMKKLAIPEIKEIEMKLLMSKNGDKVNGVKYIDENTAAQDTDTYKDTRLKDSGIVQNIFDGVTDMIIVKKFLLSIAPIGLSLAVFADTIFTKMLPHALYAMDWNSEAVSWALSLLGSSDLITRIVFAVSSSRLSEFGSREKYVIGLAVAFFARIGMLWSENPVSVQTFLIIIGVSRCGVVLLIPLVVAEAVGSERFTSAFGVVMLMLGVFNLVLGPVIGAVRDLTDSYSTVFYILASCYCIILMFWCIEILYKKNKHKWANKKNALDKS